MIKAIFFDIDGTLLSHTTGRVSAEAAEALALLRRKGILLLAATGRHILEFSDLPVNHLEFDGYVTLNGQLCLDRNRKLFYGNPIAPEDAKRLLLVFERREMPVMIVEKDRMYLNFVNDAVRRAQADISTPVPETGVYTGEEIYQFILYDRGWEVDELVRTLNQSRMIRWHERAVDVIPEKGGKVAGIRRFLEDCSISQEEIMAFGDGENDMDMLKFAGTGIAMGNADTQVKAIADEVTESVDENGVVRALYRHGLL